MPARAHLRRFIFLFAVFAVCCAAGCTTALGPGYTIEKQEVRVHFLPAPEPKIQIEADYNLRNSGNRALDSLELRLPGRRRFHVVAPHADWDGSALSFEASAAVPRNTVFHFPSSWQVGARHTLHLSAEILPPGPGESSLSFSSDAFFLPAQGWSPELLPATGLFPTGGVPPAKWELKVLVPDKFLVHTSGREIRPARIRGELLYRATQTSRDYYPFVIAGQYVSSALDTPNQKVYVWTRTAQPSSSLANAGASLVHAINAYNLVFGDRAKEAHPLWIVECPVTAGCFSAPVSSYAKFFGNTEEPTSAEMASLDTVLADFSGGAPRIGAAVAPSLAASWLGYGQNPGYYEQEAPLNALPAFAAALGRESIEGQAVREETIRRALRVVPWNAPKQKMESPDIVRAKSFLFFYALRERYGQEVFDSALHHMLTARRGRGFDLADLISAFEQETHQNVAEFVRLWIKHPGVPDEFRARHEEVSAQANSLSKEDVP